MVNPCALCKANCCKTYIITVTSFDVKRIIEKGHKPDFVKFHPPNLLAYDPDSVLDFTDDYRGGLLGFKSHPCNFIKNNRCTIYEYSPLSCKRYPFDLSGKINTRLCPVVPSLAFRLTGVSITHEEVLSEYNEYRRIVQEWNKSPGKKSECLEFLLESTSLAEKK